MEKRKIRQMIGMPNLNNSKFPGGLKPVGDSIHSKGLKFGVYGRWDRMIAGKGGSEAVYAKFIADAGADFLKKGLLNLIVSLRDFRSELFMRGVHNV